MLSLGRNILVWVFRHLLALGLILLILIALPPIVSWLQAQNAASRAISTERSTLAEARARFDSWSAREQAVARGRVEAAARGSDLRLRARRAQIGRDIALQRSARLGGLQLGLAAAGGDADRVFGHYRAGATIALLEQERRYIDAILAARSARGGQADLRGRRLEAQRQVHASYARWRAAQDRVEALNRRPLAGARNFLCRTARPRIGCTNYRALAAARTERDAALAENRQARATIAAIDRAAAALTATRAQSEDLSAALASQRRALETRAAQVEAAAGRNWIHWIRQPVVETLPTAMLILAGIIFAPLAGKALLYFIVAPLAARRPPIRLVPGEKGQVAIEGAPAAVSQQVRLAPGDQLLVVPEAVQSTPHDADKATQWLLSWSMPLSSLASGMVALVRIRPRRPDEVLISATGNPLAEIALLAVAQGSALTIRPRALRGIVHPAARPVLITRHWRLNLSAWLTLQFRYLVCHGPCTLVVQGTRGVRLEAADRGRGINQAATIGFSARLAYSVRRSEAFGAYLIGKQELFNDSFEGGPGWYVYEEMPREGEKSGLWGRGIRGLGDAVLRVFGI